MRALRSKILVIGLPQMQPEVIREFAVTCLWSIITMALSCTIFDIFDFKKYFNLEIWVRGHSRSSKLVLFNKPA